MCSILSTLIKCGPRLQPTDHYCLSGLA